MITNGFTYIAVLVFIAALLVWLQRYTKSKFFDYAPPIVLLYLITMILCTLGAWDMARWVHGTWRPPSLPTPC